MEFMSVGSSAFYRQQAAHLTALAAQIGDRTLRQQFLHIAKSKEMLADLYAASPAATLQSTQAETL